jgi:hypothetical protein
MVGPGMSRKKMDGNESRPFAIPFLSTRSLPWFCGAENLKKNPLQGIGDSLALSASEHPILATNPINQGETT